MVLLIDKTQQIKQRLYITKVRLQPPLRKFLFGKKPFFLQVTSGLEEQGYAWQPRRHYKHIDEQRPKTPQLDFSERKDIRKEQQLAAEGMGQVVQDVAKAAQNIGKAVQNNKSQEDLCISMSAPAPNRVSLRPSSQQHLISPPLSQKRIGIFGLIIVGLIVLLIISREKLKSFFRFSRKNYGGKWVYDRSLGGKMIFVPDLGQEDTVIEQQVFDSQLNKLRRKEGSGWAVAVASDDEKQMEVSQYPLIPIWWSVPLPKTFVSQALQESCRQQAQLTLKSLEVAKLTMGQDYSPFLLLDLYRHCREGDVSVQPQTISGAEALYRTAVEISLKEVMLTGKCAKIQGYITPIEYVAGFGECIGISESRAVEICLGVIAARIRAELLGIAASIRSSLNSTEIQEYIPLLNIFQVFPIQANMPQTDMIGKSLEQKTTLQERKTILEMLAANDWQNKAVFAQLLGFNPKLVFNSK